MTPATRQWAEQRNLPNRPGNRETLIYILGRISRGETLPPEVLVFLAEHPKMWTPKDPGSH
jgi:hypothetical protein